MIAPFLTMIKEKLLSLTQWHNSHWLHMSIIWMWHCYFHYSGRKSVQLKADKSCHHKFAGCHFGQHMHVSATSITVWHSYHSPLVFEELLCNWQLQLVEISHTVTIQQHEFTGQWSLLIVCSKISTGGASYRINVCLILKRSLYGTVATTIC